jgi:hypothetical protein
LDIAVFENSSKFAGGVESYSNAEGSTWLTTDTYSRLKYVNYYVNLHLQCWLEF